MNILFFEDRPLLSVDIEDHFEKEKYNVVICRTCGAVYDKFNNNDQFDCYIMDLNAPIFGLPEHLHDKTENGLLTGWVLLIDYILEKDKDALDKTIIFSEYITLLEKYIFTQRTSQKEKEYFYRIKQRNALLRKSEGFIILENTVASLAQQNEAK